MKLLLEQQPRRLENLKAGAISFHKSDQLSQKRSAFSGQLLRQRREHSYDVAIQDKFKTVRRLLEPPVPPKRPIGFLAPPSAKS